MASGDSDQVCKKPIEELTHKNRSISTEQSGLFSALLTDFKKASAIDVKVLLLNPAKHPNVKALRA